MLEEKERNENHYRKMTEEKEEKLVLSLAFPTIVAMLITSIYSLVDTIFVSQLGTSAVAAVGLVFSFITMIQAIGYTIGMGAGTLASRALGAKKSDQADVYASTGFFFALLVSLLFSIISLIFLPTFLRLLGASETILPYAEHYALFILLTSPFMCLSFVLINYLRAEGHAMYGMIGMTAGALLNILLDALFIFGLDLGAAGAAFATSVSHFASFIILLFFFIKKKSSLNIEAKAISFNRYISLDILYTGLPTLARQGLASIAYSILIVNASMFGDAAVASMSIVNRISFFTYAVILGLGQGYFPISAFNYGAERYDRVYRATRFTTRFGSLLMLLFAIILFVFDKEIILLFRRGDAEVLKIGAMGLRCQALTLVLLSLITVTNVGLQSTGSSGQATLLASSRQGIFYIPLVLILPHVIGIWGLVTVQMISDVLSFMLAIFLYRGFLKELDGHIYAQHADFLANNSLIDNN